MTEENPLVRLRRWFYVKPPALRYLLAINIGVFLIALVAAAAGSPVLARTFALDPAFPDVLARPWQVLTYSFLHLPGRGLFFGLIHLAFNMFWLVWLGEEYEQLFGTGRMWVSYLGAAVAGALLTIGAFLSATDHPAFAGPVYGASAAVVGVITAVSVHFPHKRIGLLFFGMVPLRTALIVFLVLDVLFGIGGGTFFISHIGGAVFGLIYARSVMGGGNSSRPARSGGSKKWESGGFLQRVESWLAGRPKGEDRETHRVERDEELDGDAEVDRILDKISSEGYDSLTEREKRTLYEASNR